MNAFWKKSADACLFDTLFRTLGRLEPKWIVSGLVPQRTPEKVARAINYSGFFRGLFSVGPVGDFFGLVQPPTHLAKRLDVSLVKFIFLFVVNKHHSGIFKNALNTWDGRSVGCLVGNDG